MKIKTIIIAEAGVNHNGNFKLAKKLIYKAKSAGADIVKFQVFKTEDLTTKQASVAQYQKKTKFKKQHFMLEKLELSEKNFVKLNNLCKKLKIEFCASFFNSENLQLIKKLNMKTIKIPSGEITNYFLLREIAKFNKKVILSTGMSTSKDIGKAINVLKKFGTKKNNITILHCNTEYPSPIEDINLLAMKALKKKFNVNVGYSDHSLSSEVPVSAVAIGATVIEKHLTLNNNLPGPDHKSSLNPKEFANMVKSIRNTEKILGKEKKIITKSEKKNIKNCRQYLVAKKYINKNEIFSFKNLTCKRTGRNGISPMDINKIIYKKSKKAYRKDEKI